MIYLPPWLIPLMGARERAIAEAPDAMVRQLLVDDHENDRLPAHQRYVESRGLKAHFWIDAKRRQIID